MGKIKRMDQVRLIIETYLSTKSIKATCRRLHISRNTVKTYIRRGTTYDQDLNKVLALEQSAFLEVFYPSHSTGSSLREKHFKDKISYWLKELPRVGVTRHLLWEEYRQEYPDGYSYSQFCERIRAEIYRRKLTIALDHSPGEVMQADFTGKKMHWIDPQTAEVHECEVLVCVFPHSQYTFAIALASQQVTDFIHGLNQAFLFFAALPKAILSDNLKSYVTKADRYDPDFNELCRQLAAHYQIDLTATRVGKPQDKASVENMVSTVYRRIYAPLRNDVFHSLEQINEAIKRQLKWHNSQPYQKKNGNRKEIFDTYERPLMKELPADLFEVKRITKSKARRNYHVYIGEEKNFYSVPYQFAGSDTIIIYTSKIVEIYADNQRIAIHSRLLSKGMYQYQTKAEHMPRNHQEWKKARGYNAAYFLKEADKIGPATRWVIQHVLVSRIHEQQSYNSCKGILKMAEKYTPNRLENACLRCQKVDKATYRMIQRILLHRLDQESDQPNLFSPPVHQNIRGPKEYQ